MVFCDVVYNAIPIMSHTNTIAHSNGQARAPALQGRISNSKRIKQDTTAAGYQIICGFDSDFPKFLRSFQEARLAISQTKT